MTRNFSKTLIYLKHGQQQMFFTTFVLVSVDGEHDGLQQGVNLCHGDQATQMCNVPGL
jgi:hypothetical protein